MNKPKILVILGQTATGKSDLAVDSAKTFHGEIISADSRQVYKGLNIGSGKITKKEMKKVPHHLLDVLSPKRTFSVSQFQKKSTKIIKDIFKKDKLPIICGGTGFYIQSIVDDLSIPTVKENKELRKKLEKWKTEKLFETLEKLDPERAQSIDRNNRVRLIRAIEIVKSIGKVPKIRKSSPYDVLQIGLEWPDNILKKRIKDRLLKRIKSGMIKEVKDLHKNGLSWKRMEQLGLEYRYVSLFLQNKISKEEMIEKLNTEIWHYAKRQKTWFKKDKRIKWFSPKEVRKIEKEIKGFLLSN
ncbi:tRNA (adenosine(37)-N6)-dimethylallyltransferase MiaA [Candidatus Nomurabacteria bacterium]|nr:tRNA (adenosine(37)-N6)-dimethylallyltransferase MiaA [Candidatus Nomurabacteria bacterium]